MRILQRTRHKSRFILLKFAVLFALVLLVISLASCSSDNQKSAPETNHEERIEEHNKENPSSEENAPTDSENPDDNLEHGGDQEEPVTDHLEQIRARFDITSPDSITVLVNKTYGLPADYEPDDLVKVDIPFIYQDESVHSLRKVAADALIEMFEAAKEDGLELAGVSGYRSHAIQKILYENYVARDGEEAANKYSAKPGHSEHSTGLAMDVADISGKCPARNCFADMEEAAWVAENAHRFGFIIRYPKGKEEITGYQYEPWHLRYVGVELASILYENEWTMEEFFLGITAADEGGALRDNDTIDENAVGAVGEVKVNDDETLDNGTEDVQDVDISENDRVVVNEEDVDGSKHDDVAEDNRDMNGNEQNKVTEADEAVDGNERDDVTETGKNMDEIDEIEHDEGTDVEQDVDRIENDDEAESGQDADSYEHDEVAGDNQDMNGSEHEKVTETEPDIDEIDRRLDDNVADDVADQG